MNYMGRSTEIIALGAIQLVEAYESGELSPVEVMRAHLAQYEAKNPEINAVFSVRAEQAMDDAKLSERRWKQSVPIGPLDGLPVLLKDSIKCAGFDYYHGSASYDGSPASEDAPPAARIKEAGGLVFGKTTMPDYGMIASGISSVFGVVRNPWNTHVSPGGSSAGSGAAVAAGIAPLAVGTDIAGSVRLPCAHNGLVGLKPSRGRVPHLQPSPIRTAGPMARSVDDAALLLSVLVRPDPRDYEAAPESDGSEYRSVAETSPNYLRGKKIGLMLDMGYGHGPDDRVLELIRSQAVLFEEAGAEISLVPKVATSDPMEALYALVQSRAYYEMSCRPAALQKGLLPFVSDWARRTEQRSAHELSQALFELEDFKARATDVLNPYDYVISPSLPIVSFPADEAGPMPDDRFAQCAYQIPFNQIGAPALSINAGFIDGLPIGMQIAGRRYDDVGVMKLARAYESLRGGEISWPM